MKAMQNQQEPPVPAIIDATCVAAEGKPEKP